MFDFRTKQEKLLEFEFPTTLKNKFKYFHTLKAEYVKFMLLAAKHDSVPTKEVDEFWHEHILHTKSYEAFCKILGKFIHHNPTETVDEDLFRDTRKRYESAGFGDNNASGYTSLDLMIFDSLCPEPTNLFNNESSFGGGEFGGSGAGSDFGASDSSSSCSSSSCSSSSCGSSCGGGD